MATNSIKKTDAITILNKIYAEATGKQELTVPTSTADFISLATTTLDLGADVVLNTISNVLSKTLFKEKEYRSSLNSLDVSNDDFGFYSRKLEVVDSDFIEDHGYTKALKNGDSVDMYTIRKRDILQTNITGSMPFQDYYTIYEKQFNTAFRSAEELAQFWAMLATNQRNKFEIVKENLERATLVNVIASKLSYDKSDKSTTHCVHLLSEFNKKTGQTLTINDLYKFDNWKHFVEFMYSRIKTISNLMKERSTEFQYNLKNKAVLHQSDLKDQKLYILSEFKNDIDTLAISNVFDKTNLNFPQEVYSISYFQTIKNPKAINVKVNLIDENGTVTATSKEVKAETVVGLLMDRDVAKVSVFDEGLDLTPFNAKGRYWNQYANADLRYIVSLTEKAVIFTLD